MESTNHCIVYPIYLRQCKSELEFPVSVSLCILTSLRLYLDSLDKKVSLYFVNIIFNEILSTHNMALLPYHHPFE